MTRARLLLVLAIALVTVASRTAGALVNPHMKPEPCGSCHARTPTTEEGKADDFHLLKESIDATCLVCHEKTCCKVGTIHHFEHPSGIDRWDRKKFQEPKTLKLYGGFITCSTCHFHSIPDGESFKMVRLAQRDGMRIEWVRLCRDCHVNF